MPEPRLTHLSNPPATRDTPHGGCSPSSAPAPAPPVLLAAPRLVGEYELGDKLGGGGMGIVYRARHRRLGKTVALKLLPTAAQDSPERVSRFLREMRAVGGLKHPHVVEAYDAGEQSGVVYLAMELVEGTDLERLVRQRGPLPVAEACELIRQAAVGLQHLYEHGLVHRDIKPSNLMRTADGVVKILDLGLARWHVRETDEKHTGTGEALGTPDYLAPEQVEDAATADVRADLYGLGGTLFYLLTGQAPFAHRRGMHAKLEAHLHAPAPDVQTLRPEVPAALAELVARLLAKRPEDRPGTPAEVAAALAVLSADGGDKPRRSPSSERRGLSPPSSRERRRRWLMMSLLLTAMLGLGTWAWLAHRPEPGPPPSGEGSGPGVTNPQAKLLTIRLRVVRGVPDGNFQPIGELGENTYRVRLNDRVEVEAELSEPAYAYLIAFNPTDRPGDREQIVPASAANRPPEKRKQISPDKRLKLDDGAGLQVFAVVASRQPLPAYSAWVKQRPPLTWKQTPATSGVVWRSDGSVLDGYFKPGFNRATEEAAGDKAVVRRLAETLRRLPGIDAVAVMGFAVDRAQ